MNETLKKYKDELILFIILFIAAGLRFYNFADFSFSNDELSALNRTQFENFSELIKGGVETDAHPAGVQVFMYVWKNIFGDSAASMRFPFVIAGILSVLFIYLIAAKWVNKTAALFAASALCFLEYPLLYSQLARPYSFGLLFCLATVFFWSRILFNSERKNILTVIGYVLSASMASYTHYFSFLTVVLIGLSGLFFMNKNTWKHYIISCIIIALLFIPHLNITFTQLGYGLSWLGKPEKKWFLDYISYCFNNSTFLLLFFISIFCGSVFINYKNLFFSKFQYLAFLFFCLPILIGYFYSVFKSPVLQYSVVIFSFPFFLIFLFSFIPQNPKPYVYIILILFTISGVSSTVIEKKFYSTQHFGEFKGLAKHIVKWNKQFGENNITRTINVNAPYYIHYYLSKFSDTSRFVKYKFSEENDLGDLIEIVNQSNTPYFVYATSNVYNPLEIKEIIRDKYPVIVEEKDYNGSEVILFKTDSLFKREFIFQSVNNFEKSYSMWELDSTMIDTSVFYSGQHSCRLDEQKIYSATFSTDYNNFPCKDSCLLNVSVEAFLTENATAEIVLSIEKPGRENEWYGSKINSMVREKGKWGKAFLSRLVGNDFEPQDKIKIYVWNTGKEKLYIDNFQVNISSIK